MNTQKNNITAQALCEAFVENKAKAEREYGTRMMQISGTAVHVGFDMYNLPCIELSEDEDSYGRAICLLQSANFQNVSNGDEVVMEGEVRSINDVIQKIVVKHCRVVEINGK